MAFNISSFSSSLQRHGVAQNNTFRMRITTPLSLQAETKASSPVIDDVEFYCQSVTLPEMAIDTTEVQQQGFGTITRRPQTMNFPILPAVFMVDQDLGMVKYFHRWAQHIINYDNSNGQYSSVDGALPFELNYKSDYATRLTVDVYGKNGAIEYSYEFGGAYPVNIGSVEESWSDNDALLTLSVGFSFDTLKVTGSKEGLVVDVDNGSAIRAPSDNPFRSGSILDQITSSAANRIAEAGSVSNLIQRGLRGTKFFK